MNVRIRRVNLRKPSEQDIRDINVVLEQSANASVFHTLEWNQLLIEQFALRYVALLATVEQMPVGFYVGFMLDNHVCRSPAVQLQSVYGGPLAIDTDQGVICELLKASERAQPFADWQIWTPPNYDVAPLIEHGYLCREMFTPIVRLGASEGELWSRLHWEKRNRIRKAAKSAVRVRVGDMTDVDAYYTMVVATLRRAGISILPKGFYRKVLVRLGSRGMARLSLAEHENQIIAGTLTLFYKDTACYWDAGWNREYGTLSPNDLLHWEVVRRANWDGFKFYDLLRLEPDRLPGIARWKSNFGGDVVRCYFLEKVLPGHRLWRAWRLLREPRRFAAKLSGHVVRFRHTDSPGVAPNRALV